MNEPNFYSEVFSEFEHIKNDQKEVFLYMSILVSLIENRNPEIYGYKYLQAESAELEILKEKTQSKDFQLLREQLLFPFVGLVKLQLENNAHLKVQPQAGSSSAPKLRTQMSFLRERMQQHVPHRRPRNIRYSTLVLDGQGRSPKSRMNTSKGFSFGNSENEQISKSQEKTKEMNLKLLPVLTENPFGQNEDSSESQVNASNLSHSELKYRSHNQDFENSRSNHLGKDYPEPDLSERLNSFKELSKLYNKHLLPLKGDQDPEIA